VSILGNRPSDRVKETPQQRDSRTLPRATRPAESDGLSSLDAEFVMVADTVERTGGVVEICKEGGREGRREGERELVILLSFSTSH